MGFDNPALLQGRGWGCFKVLQWERSGVLWGQVSYSCSLAAQAPDGSSQLTAIRRQLELPH